VISAWLFSRGAKARDHSVRENPIAALKKGTVSICIDIGSLSLAQSSLIETGLLGGEIPPISTAPRLTLTQQNGAKVTTNHLLLQRQLGKAVALLPISQPNCDFLGGKCNGRAEGGRRRGSARRSRRKPRTDKLARKFYSKWRLPLPCRSQKNALRNRRAIPTRSRAEAFP